MTDKQTTANCLLGWSHLFKLAANNPQPTPGHVFVLLPVGDCEPLSRVLLAEAIRTGEIQDGR